MFWFQQGMCFLPALLVVWASSNFILSYIIAVCRHDVDVIFPYISDTGAQPPESCIFGFMTSVTAYLALMTMYIRYKFVQRLNEDLRSLPSRMNVCVLGIGVLSCVGMCVVGTFQETTLPVVHDIGALLFFGTGVLYTVLQAAMSYKTMPHGSSLCVCHVRTAIAVLTSLTMVLSIVCGSYVRRTKLHRQPTDQDYTFHLVSAVSEWIVAFGFVSFFLTFIPDFKMFDLRVKAEILQFS